MKQWIKAFALACMVTAQAAWSQSDHSTMHHSSTAVSGESQGFAPEMDAGMQKMMSNMHAPGYTGNPDVDFLAMMIPHHEGAVEMARLVLVYGKDPLTRRLAEEIIASQTSEVAAMRERLAILRRGDDPNPGGFPALHGTRGLAPQ
ncbi:MAG TPA: DUF305 domain-containing protein [Candidatus Binatia bacterium]